MTHGSFYCVRLSLDLSLQCIGGWCGWPQESGCNMYAAKARTHISAWGCQKPGRVTISRPRFFKNVWCTCVRSSMIRHQYQLPRLLWWHRCLPVRHHGGGPSFAHWTDVDFFRFDTSFSRPVDLAPHKAMLHVNLQSEVCDLASMRRMRRRERESMKLRNDYGPELIDKNLVNFEDSNGKPTWDFEAIFANIWE